MAEFKPTDGERKPCLNIQSTHQIRRIEKHSDRDIPHTKPQPNEKAPR